MFIFGSFPPSTGTNYKVMKKAFDEGWGGVICKTLSLDSSKVRNVTPRYARKTGANGEVLAWENIELISDRPFETMLEDCRRLKEEYPDRCGAAPSAVLQHAVWCIPAWWCASATAAQAAERGVALKRYLSGT